MMGGVDTNKGIIEWITCLAHSFIKLTILSVASSSYTDINTATSIAKADYSAIFHFLTPEHRKPMKYVIGTTIPLKKGCMDQERKNLRSTTILKHLDFYPSYQKPKSII